MTAKQRMFWIVLWILALIHLGGTAQGQTAAAQALVQPQVVGRPIRDGQVTTVFLAPRYVTALRMPEPINSVVVGFGSRSECSAENEAGSPFSAAAEM